MIDEGDAKPEPQAETHSAGSSLLDSAHTACSITVDSFLAEVAKISRLPGALTARRSMERGNVVAKRYELVAHVGRGAHGTVWSAHDAVTGGVVAVKLLVASSPAHAADIRAEIVALRRLRLPGAAHLIDEGIEDGAVFVVMPLFVGRPFPGLPVPTPWEKLRGPTERLLEVLGRVHEAGIVHRDLKPANVLVDADGLPTLLDFGLSQGSLLEAATDDGRILGTPAYLSPEQVVGGHVGPRADLYAVGTMLFRSLSGRYPHEAREVRDLLAAKFSAPRPLLEVAPSTPAHVAEVVDALLAPAPEERPAAAAEVVQRLRGEPVSGPTSRTWSTPPSQPQAVALSLDDLKGLFAASGRLDWIREDGARILHRQTEGDPARVAAMVDRWVAEGRFRWGGDASDGLVVHPATLERIEAEQMAATFPKALDPFMASAVAHARAMAAAGWLGSAIAMLHESMLHLRRAPALSIPWLEQVLTFWAEVALSDGAPDALDRVLYELCRCGGVSSNLAQLEDLVRAALAVGAWTERALELASAVPPLESPALERLRHSVRMMAARRTSREREEQLIAELDAWASSSADPMAKDAFAGWLGRLRYRQGAFREAARLHMEAADGALWAAARAAAMAQAASALMEAFAFDEAEVLAQRALSLFGATRHTFGRAQAQWIARHLAYRRGVGSGADPGWVDEVARLALRDLEGLCCLTEAALAFRANDADSTTTLARRGERAWASLGENAGAGLLVSALAIVHAPDAVERARDLAARALSCATPGVGIQVLGLVAKHGIRVDAQDPRVQALANQIPLEHWSLRVDVLSVDEALEALRRRPAPDCAPHLHGP